MLEFGFWIPLNPKSKIQNPKSKIASLRRHVRRRDPPIHQERRTVHERRFIACEEKSRIGHLLGFAEAARRDVHEATLTARRVGEQFLKQRCLDGTWTQ